jgi:PAS domain-containing protein
VRDRAQKLWDERLSVIEVSGASPDQLTTLYSNLYRLYLYPSSAFENTGTAILILEADTTISDANREAEIVCGCRREDLVGRSWTESGPRGSRTDAGLPFGRRAEGAKQYTTDSRMGSKSGGVACDRHDPGTMQSVVSAIDVRTQCPDSSCRSAGQFRALVETSPTV